MFTIAAPYPSLQTTTVLPNPEFGDTEALVGSVARKLAIDGTRYTYVRTSDRRRFNWTFHLTRNKALELIAFIKAYHTSMVKVEDHNGTVIVGVFRSNPFEIETMASARPAITPLRLGEQCSVMLEFEGVVQ
jgi:hypothetical protein